MGLLAAELQAEQLQHQSPGRWLKNLCASLFGMATGEARSASSRNLSALSRGVFSTMLLTRVTFVAAPTLMVIAGLTVLSFRAAQPPKAPPAASKEVAPIGLAAESPEKIIAKMAKNYAAAGSYEDEGVVTIVFSGPMGKRTVKRPFSTKFVRPKLYRYEFTERFGDGENDRKHFRHLE